ncbi:MAG: DUF1624 domain-containing protein [Spirochaetales bacterium]|nr:DUF1624 domain-containing protein [Spirochaetales bacterium]
MGKKRLLTEKKRLETPDNMRGFAILFMILIHVMNLYGNNEATHGWQHQVIDFLAGPPAAPVFMCTMGFFFILKKPGFFFGIKRGVLLLLIGYGLNIVKGFLPVFIARHCLQFDSELIPIYYTNYYLIFNVEILIFAGIAYIIMNLLSRVSVRPEFFLVSAGIVTLISPFLWGLGSETAFLQHIVTPLWGADPDLVIFPVFPWIVYPLLGMAAGGIYRNQSNPKRLSMLSGLFGGMLTVLGGSLLLIDFDRFFHDYGQQSWGALLAFSGFIFLWGLVIRFLGSLIPSRFKPGFLAYLSRNITQIYIIQWILLGWLFFCIPFHSLSLIGVCIVNVFITALSCLITEGYNRITSYKRISTS